MLANFSASEESEWLNLNCPTTLPAKQHNLCAEVDPNCISTSKYCRKESFAFLRILVIHCLINQIETGGTQWHCTGKTHTGSITDKDLCYQWACWLRQSAKTANSAWGHPVRGEHLDCALKGRQVRLTSSRIRPQSLCTFTCKGTNTTKRAQVYKLVFYIYFSMF